MDFVRRNRRELTAWALPAGVAVVGTVASIALLTPLPAIAGTVVGGLIRAGIAIDRQERERARVLPAQRLAADEIAKVARARILRRTLWRDAEAEAAAREKNVAAIVAGKGPDVIAYLGVPIWTAERLIRVAELATDPRTRSMTEWFEIMIELREARDEFAAAVGAWSPSLSESGRELMQIVVLETDKAALAAKRMVPALANAKEAEITAQWRAFYMALMSVDVTTAHLEREGSGS